MEQEIEAIIGEVIKRNRRTLSQNALMWSLLSDLSKQVIWADQKLSKQDWKWVFTAAVRKQRIVPGIDGEMVYLGEPTSGMSKKEMSDMIDMICAFGNERGVEWTDPV